MDPPGNPRVFEGDDADVLGPEKSRHPVEFFETTAIRSFDGVMGLSPMVGRARSKALLQCVSHVGSNVVGLGEAKEFEVVLRGVEIADGLTPLLRGIVGHTRESKFRKRVVDVNSHLGAKRTPDAERNGLGAARPY